MRITDMEIDQPKGGGEQPPQELTGAENCIESTEQLALIRAMQLSDSVLPVGSFAFSNGLESALQTGVVKDEQSLEAFTNAVLRQSARTDGIGLIHAFRASQNSELKEIIRFDQELWSRRFGEELQSMSARMGKKLGELSLHIFSSALIQQWVESIKLQSTPGCYAIGLGVVSQQLALSERSAFTVHQYGIAAMILGAAARLMRIDHYQTQRILYQTGGRVANDYREVEHLSMEEIHGFAPIHDILAGHHVETTSRLFMS